MALISFQTWPFTLWWSCWPGVSSWLGFGWTARVRVLAPSGAPGCMGALIPEMRAELGHH